jgi:hypothetical protein
VDQGSTGQRHQLGLRELARSDMPDGSECYQQTLPADWRLESAHSDNPITRRIGSIALAHERVSGAG